MVDVHSGIFHSGGPRSLLVRKTQQMIETILLGIITGGLFSLILTALLHGKPTDK